MNRCTWLVGLFVAGLFLGNLGSARADRAPTYLVATYRAKGVRNDITVPYLTNGRSTILVYPQVAPRVYASPIVDDPRYPNVKPVYNLPYYGARQAFGSKSNGATDRTK
jgi:hypothetical protein